MIFSLNRQDSRTYFFTGYIGYSVALVLTFVMMYVFKHAQVRFCIIKKINYSKHLLDFLSCEGMPQYIFLILQFMIQEIWIFDVIFFELCIKLKFIKINNRVIGYLITMKFKDLNVLKFIELV